MTNSSDILREINKFINDPKFNYLSNKVAESMVTHILKDGGKTWRQAAAINGKGKIIFKALKNELNSPVGLAVHNEILRNAEIIKTVPLTIARRFTNHIAKESMTGKRASEIAEDLLGMFPSITNAQAKCIARTESSKTSSALNQSRCENLGIKAYIYRTSLDKRTRESHRKLEGVICFWNQPFVPEKVFGIKTTLTEGHAGCWPNCRCYSESLISVDDTYWPHKCLVNGKIVTMTKKQFKEYTGMVD